MSPLPPKSKDPAYCLQFLLMTPTTLPCSILTPKRGSERNTVREMERERVGGRERAREREDEKERVREREGEKERVREREGEK